MMNARFKYIRTRVGISYEVLDLFMISFNNNDNSNDNNDNNNSNNTLPSIFVNHHRYKSQQEDELSKCIYLPTTCHFVQY